jgi:hypothetical protein
MFPLETYGVLAQNLLKTFPAPALRAEFALLARSVGLSATLSAAVSRVATLAAAPRRTSPTTSHWLVPACRRPAGPGLVAPGLLASSAAARSAAARPARARPARARPARAM